MAMFERSTRQTLNPLTFSAEASHAKISRLLEAALEYLEHNRLSTGNFTGLLQPFGHGGFLLKMFLNYYPPTADLISESSLNRWWNSGMAWPGGYLMLNTSDCPNDARESTLLDILESPGPHLFKYYMSPRACAGVLRAAAERNKRIPLYLRRALEDVVKNG